MAIQYITGDATQPEGADIKLIVHICNNVGKWGKGFVLAISKRWPEPEKIFKESFKNKQNAALGCAQFVEVSDNLLVANVIGQDGIVLRNENRSATNLPPVRYEAIREGLEKVAVYAISHVASVHMPRIGTGLAGGKWELIEPIIKEKLIERGISVTVYEYESK